MRALERSGGLPGWPGGSALWSPTGRLSFLVTFFLSSRYKTYFYLELGPLVFLGEVSPKQPVRRRAFPTKLVLKCTHARDKSPPQTC